MSENVFSTVSHAPRLTSGRSSRTVKSLSSGVPTSVKQYGGPYKGALNHEFQSRPTEGWRGLRFGNPKRKVAR